MKNFGYFLFLLIIFLTSSSAIEIPVDSNLKKPTLLQVPIVRQATPYSCGAASLLSVLYYWKVFNDGELSLHEPLQTEKEFGTQPMAIVEFSKSLGLKSELKKNLDLKDIEAALTREEPVIVDYQAWGEPENNDYSNTWDSGHYSVVVGFDDRYLYLMDPMLNSSYGKVEKTDFLKRWHDVDARNGDPKYFLKSAIFIKGTDKLKSFPSKISPIN